MRWNQHMSYRAGTVPLVCMLLHSIHAPQSKEGVFVKGVWGPYKVCHPTATILASLMPWLERSYARVVDERGWPVFDRAAH